MRRGPMLQPKSFSTRCRRQRRAQRRFVLRSICTNPNMVLFGEPGRGKSSTVVAFLLRMMLTGVRTLISGDVTVYLSARNAGSDTNQASPVELNLRRTNTSSNLLILDGISQYNTNDSTPADTAASRSPMVPTTFCR